MNDVTVLEKADQYMRWVLSGQELPISNHVKEMAEGWILANQLMMKYPKELDARKMYMQIQDCSEGKAIRDMAIAQYVFGKIQMPNRAYEIKKLLDRSNKLYDYAINLVNEEPKVVSKIIKDALDMHKNAIAMLPEEVEPPDMAKYLESNTFTMDPGAIGKSKKDLNEMRNIFTRFYDRAKPKANFENIAEDANVIRS